MKIKYQIYYTKDIAQEPIIYYIIKNFNVIPNIFRAKITGEKKGYMVVELEGDKKNIKDAVKYLKSRGAKVERFKRCTQLNREKCTHCSHCIPYCPTGALHIPNRKTMELAFNSDKCIECRACISVCPFWAITDLNDSEDTDL